MSERGESLDPVRMLNVASWRKLRDSRGRVPWGLFAADETRVRGPNLPRVCSSAKELKEEGR